MKKVMHLFVLSILMVCSARSEQVDSIIENLKIRLSNFDFKERPSPEFWSWIQLNLDQIVQSQVESGTRKYGDKVVVNVVSGLDRKISVTGSMPIMKAMNDALEFYQCFAILDNSSLLIVPDTIYLDKNKYIIINKRFHQVK